MLQAEVLKGKKEHKEKAKTVDKQLISNSQILMKGALI